MNLISQEHVVMIATATLNGTLARFLTIKEDYRQYPTLPNGYLTHVFTGFIASALGAVAIPALVTQNFVAVTFLALAIQQFRDIRRIEKESLKDLEDTEYTLRGNAYIDGIAKTFEVRNYFSLIVAFITALMMQVIHFNNMWLEIPFGIFAGMLVLYPLTRFSKGQTVGDIAIVTPGVIEVKGSELYVDGIFVSNLLGTERARTALMHEGIAAVIDPIEPHYRITLDNYGQRQAILFDVTRMVGVKRFHYTRKDYDSGKVILVIVPVIPDIQALLKTIEKAPLIESVKKSHTAFK